MSLTYRSLQQNASRDVFAVYHKLHFPGAYVYHAARLSSLKVAA